MKCVQYQVDAFTDRVFHGNPAAVCPLDHWLDDAVLQAIAAENNLSETAFYVPAGDGFHLRWFTPNSEVDLCGHATLATAHVLFSELGHTGTPIRFDTRSGRLTVTQQPDGLLTMDFPAQPPAPCLIPERLVEALGVTPVEVLQADDYIAVLASEAEVRDLKPDMARLQQLELRGVAVTAPGEDDDVDFVSRFFAPKYGIPEDPVTGSAHCELAPYWEAVLSRNPLTARQISARGGELHCRVKGDRVELAGRTVTFMQAEIRF